jgi:hypothetical protein
MDAERRRQELVVLKTCAIPISIGQVLRDTPISHKSDWAYGGTLALRPIRSLRVVPDREHVSFGQ